MKGCLVAGGKTDVNIRAERVAGDSKFNGWKLWNLALKVSPPSQPSLRI